MDFTQNLYRSLLKILQEQDFHFLTFEQYCERKFLQDTKWVVLRHDIDKKAKNALQFAKIEHSLGVKATYYFRISPNSNQPKIIKQVVALGHEIGYHYEDLNLCKGDESKAIKHFKTWLDYFRKFYPVKTICMHGSPYSKLDNKDLWINYDYKNYNIIGEPYFDTDFNSVFYLTDTGRCWNGEKFSVRDKVKTPFTEKYHTTKEIISAIKSNKIPTKLLITTHPQRWTNNLIEWSIELCSQYLKNLIKRYFV